MTGVFVLVTGPPAAGKTTLAGPLAATIGLPLIGKDLIKEALFDALGTGDRAWSRRLGKASYEVLYAVAGALPAAVLDANLGPEAVPRLQALDAHLIEVFCRCPVDEVERRFASRAPTRHPGHVDHLLAPEIKATLIVGAGPLHLGPVLEVDTTHPVDVAGVAAWAKAQTSPPGRPSPPAPGSGPPEGSLADRERRWAWRSTASEPGGQDPGAGPM
jgi:predicted kinase